MGKMKANRRTFLEAAAIAVPLSALSLGTIGAKSALAAELARPFAPPAGPRARVVYCNDLSGDIDGLFATVHFLLSSSIDLRAIIGTGPNAYDPAGENSASAARIAGEILALMGRSGTVPIFKGLDANFSASRRPEHAPSVQAIIDEAMREDTRLPLYVAVGGGLTEVAMALKIEPRIADRFTLVWIGGGRPHPEGVRYEPNFSIDPGAAQYIFNDMQVPIWHVPSEVYQTCIVSSAELQAYVAPCGDIGAWLYGKVMSTAEKYKPAFNPGSTWTLGDNPLVLLIELQDWVPSAGAGGHGPFTYGRTGSSQFVIEPAPRLNAEGNAIPRQSGRLIRRYVSVDNRLMMGDLFAKLRTHYPPRI